MTPAYSDARSAQIVDERIRPALESGATIGSSKPTLLVVDEIDGATGGSDSVSVESEGAYSQLIDSIRYLVSRLHPQAGPANP